jgi:hypothetical protein
VNSGLPKRSAQEKAIPFNDFANTEGGDHSPLVKEMKKKISEHGVTGVMNTKLHADILPH